MNKSKFINFRVSSREKEYLNFLAKAEDLKVSQLIREIILKRISKERLILKK